MLSPRKTSDAAFINAVMANDNPTISRFYRESCLPIGQQLGRRFPKADADVVSSALNDALLTVISQYINTGKIFVEAGKVKGASNGKVTGLVAYIARCTIIRHFKWESKYGTTDIENHLRKLEISETAPDRSEEKRTNSAVLQAFDSLSDKCQDILSCRLIHGMSYEEVLNEDIGTNSGTLRVEAHRCVKQLRARYLKFFFESPAQ